MRSRLSLLIAALSFSCEGQLDVTIRQPADGPTTAGGAASGLPGSGGGSTTNPAGGAGPAAGGAAGGGDVPTAMPRFSCSEPQSSGTTFPSLRRLTKLELTNTWSELLGPIVASDAQVVAALSGLPADALQTLSTVSDAVPSTWVPTLSTAAKRSVVVLLANPTERARLLGACTTQPLTDACVTQVIAGWGARALRRDPDAAETQALLAYYRSSGGGDAGLGFLMRRLLQGPSMAFHFEDRGVVDGARLKLTPFEVAARIAYLTTGTPPDEALLTAARANQLSTSAQVRSHVLRLLATPNGHARVRDLFRYYLQLGQTSDPFAPLAMTRGVSPTGLGMELNAEALDFGEQVFFDAADGSFRQLMTSPLAMAKTERVARIFGQTCVGAPATTSFGWNDASTFFHPDGAAVGPAQQTLTQSGWFVWQLPAGRLTQPSTELRLDLTATSADGVPLQLEVRLDDAPLIATFSATPGASTLRATVSLAAGVAAKVGVNFKNAAPGRSLTMGNLTVVGPMTNRCAPAPAATHPGLLHRPALLLGTSNRTSPILRGAHVRKLFLCTDLGMPDLASVAARQTEVGNLDALSNRERATALTSAPQCNGCHQLINPLGFPFEAFDQLGMTRTEEQRFDASGAPTVRSPIDTSVMEPRLDFVGGPSSISDSNALVAALASSRQAQACFTQRAFEFLRRSPIDTTKDGCALAAAEAHVATGSLRDVLADLIAADDIFFRAAP